MAISRTFASDNNSGVHPEIMSALARANEGHVVAYGDDPFTREAVDAIRGHLGRDCAVKFVWNGTGANVLCLRALADTYHAVLTSQNSHIHVDECGAPEAVAGCKVIAVPAKEGKITPEDLKPLLRGFGDPHHPQPRVISVAQATELGTVYTPAELRALADLAHGHDMYLHVDGARIANAAAHLGLGLAEITRDCGVDALSLGGTKNGVMFGEAVVLFDGSLAKTLPYYRKQNMQLASKMRFIGAQFAALFSGDLWLRNARHANAMARKLADSLAGAPGFSLVAPVQSNGVFARIPAAAIPALQQENFFYVWDPNRSEVRWMCSFDTTEEDVAAFAAKTRTLLESLASK